MRKPLLIKALSLILAITLTFLSLPLNIIAEDGGEATYPVKGNSATKGEISESHGDIIILHGGAEEYLITLPEDGTDELRAVAKLDTNSRNRSWQILTPSGDRWIDIAAKTQERIGISYTLIASMLNAEGAAYLRYVVRDGDIHHVSEPVKITVSYNVPGGDLPIAAAPEAAADTKDLSPRASLMASEEYSTYTIVINYLFENGGIAFEPYGASVAAGSSFERTVTTPTVVGYDPFIEVDGELVDAKKVTLNYTNITENKTVNVIFRPAMVKFYVHHHLQNLTDDDYSLEYDFLTESEGLTGSLTPDGLELSYDVIPGFKALPYQKLTIAADGSTVVEIRYNRYYYLVSFDMDGGFGTEPVYTRYGSPVGANTPTRHGYVFDGWELVKYGDRAPTDVEKSKYDINAGLITLPDSSLTYRAKWITQLTNYTLVFWKENAHDDGFSFWGYLDNLQAMSGSTVDGSDRVSELASITDESHFNYCDALTDKGVMIEGDGSTVINVYYTRSRYAINFVAPGLCTIEENHTHSIEGGCYKTICTLGHVHTEECNPTLICTEPEHKTHTDECIICGKEEHTHSQACCALSEHTHTKECWVNVGNTASPSGAPSNPENGYIHSARVGLRRYYYIYINGTWYSYSGRNASAGDIVDPVCGKAEHTHGTAGCSCTEEPHIHDDGCYRDALHSHTPDDCYSYSCDLGQHEHNASCYILNCGMPEGHSHKSSCHSASSNSTVKTVYRKYEESLEDIWPITDDNGVTYDSGERWKPSDSSTYSQVLVYIANMPEEDFTLTLDTSNYDAYTMNYYLETLEGEPYDTSRVRDGVTRYYKLHAAIKAKYNYITEAEDFFDITGFTKYFSDPSFSGGQIDINGGGTVSFYYTRITDHELEFRSNGEVVTEFTKTGIPYGAPLLEYNFTPPYPSSLEPNAFFFDGWYTTPGHFPGTEVDWNTATMSEGDVMYYAKWSPIIHTVEVYLDSTLSEKIGDTQSVSHGSFANAPEGNVSNGNYIFQGWFYKTQVNGEEVEKAYVFSGIPVMEDLKIYAKWSSHVYVDYKISYRLYDTDVEIAPPTVGNEVAGNNRTFYALAGDELNEGYRTGYYPLTSSHTVTMSAESDHEFTFYYVYVESVPYKVEYLDENGNEIGESKYVMDNNYSVVTETFVKIDEKMPDAYQKRLILSADGTDADGDGVLDVNVIKFYYASDSQHAFYRVVHYIESVTGDGEYREYSSEETIGIIGNTYTFSPLTMSGFSYNKEKTRINELARPGASSYTEELTESGLLVEFFYDRVEISYTVNYLEADTGKVLHTQKKAWGIFGETVVEYAPGLTSRGYTLASENAKQITLSTNGENVINFYYIESIYSIKYELIGNAAAGTLSTSSENVSALTGEAGGSYPMLSAGYHFVGWFRDEACRVPVDPTWVDAETNTLTPRKADGEIWEQSSVYYAKVDPDFTSLIISTLGASDVDEEQAFILHVRGTSAESASVSITLTLIGNTSAVISDLPIGSYEVSVVRNWAFRYDPDENAKQITLAVDAENKITFSFVRTDKYWLDGNSSAR